MFSKTLQSTDWENTRIARDPGKEIASLKTQPGKRVIVWGGATLISRLFQMGLVDELRITIAPVVLGGGLPLFPGLKDRFKLVAIDGCPLECGAIILRYGVDVN